jgi:membrane protease YdiL (CAAX protease family)
MPWDFALILFLLAVLVPWRGAVRVRQLLAMPRISSTDRLVVYASTIALQWAITALVVWRCYARGVGLAELGVALPNVAVTVATAVTLSLVFTWTQFASLQQLARMPREKQGFIGEMARKLLPQDAVEGLAFSGLAVTVALCEEFIYRGFVWAAIREASGGSELAALAGSSLLFGLAHAYQGRRGLVVTAVAGLIFGGARMWTESLVAPMVAHLVADMVAGLAAPRLLQRVDAEAAKARTHSN